MLVPQSLHIGIQLISLVSFISYSWQSKILGEKINKTHSIKKNINTHKKYERIECMPFFSGRGKNVFTLIWMQTHTEFSLFYKHTQMSSLNGNVGKIILFLTWSNLWLKRNLLILKVKSTIFLFRHQYQDIHCHLKQLL